MVAVMNRRAAVGRPVSGLDSGGGLGPRKSPIGSDFGCGPIYDCPSGGPDRCFGGTLAWRHDRRLKKLRYREKLSVHIRRWPFRWPRRLPPRVPTPRPRSPKGLLGAALVCHPTGNRQDGGDRRPWRRCAPEIGNVLVLHNQRSDPRPNLCGKSERTCLSIPGSSNLGPGIRLAKMCYARTKKRGSRVARRAVSRGLPGLLSPELANIRLTISSVALFGDRREDDLSEALSRTDSILVMTVQMLVGAAAGAAGTAPAISLRGAAQETSTWVLFDEGHYEPGRQVERGRA